MGGRQHRRRVTGRFTYVNQWVKYSLCLANFIFLATGTIVLVFGVIAFVESGGMPKHSNITAIQWVFNLTVLCIGVGIITVLVSLAGFIGSLRENRCLLKSYYSVLTVLFLVEVVCCVLFFIYRDTAMRKVEDLIRITFVTQYREPGFEDTTNFMDFIQKELHCCGPRTYTDWTANRYFSCDETKSSQICGVPYSCCRRMNDINIHVINTLCGLGVQKLSAPMASNRVWTVGCVQATASLVEANIVPVACSVSGIAILQLVAILLAKTLHTQIGDQLRLLHQEANGF